MPRRPDSSRQTQLVLAALYAAPSAWHYGYDLSRQLELRSGTLYPILIRLAERGFLDARWLEPERDGRPARHAYRLTQAGLSLARSRVTSAGAIEAPRVATGGASL